MCKLLLYIFWIARTLCKVCQRLFSALALRFHRRYLIRVQVECSRSCVCPNVAVLHEFEPIKDMLLRRHIDGIVHIVSNLASLLARIKWVARGVGPQLLHYRRGRGQVWFRTLVAATPGRSRS